MVDGESVALGPVAVKLADVVEPGRIVVRRLEILGVEHPVGVGKVELPDCLLSLGTAEAGNVGDGASTRADGNGRLVTHGREAVLDKGRTVCSLELRSGSCHHLRLAIDQEGWLVDVVGLTLNLSWNLRKNLRLRLNIVCLLLKGYLTNGRLLRNAKAKVSQAYFLPISCHYRKRCK